MIVQNATGLCQVLEVYATASLDAQHNSWFPTTVIEAVDTAKKKNQSLFCKMVLGKDRIKKAGIGCPNNHIDEMLKERVYKPYVPTRSITANN